jgi:uncharacterized protein YkwD
MDRMSLRHRAAAVVGVAALLTAPAAGAATHSAARSAAACPNADQTTANATVSELTIGVRCLIEQERAAAGLDSVAPNRRLAVAASRHAGDMVARRYFGHTSLGGATFVDRIRRTGYLPPSGGWRAGEILAWTSGDQATPRGIVSAWMGSPEHRRILLDPALSDVGVGLAIGSPRAQDPSAITADADFGSRG